jgi:MFS family permease
VLAGKERWVLALLVISAVINYFDRANLAVGAVSIQRELHLSESRLGLLLSAFSWTYAAMQLSFAAGWLADRFNVSLVYAAGFFLWSGSTAGAGFASAFGVFFALRLLLGAGESIAYPCYSRIFASFPEHHRGLANALIDAGTKSGPALGTLIGGLAMARFGWRAFFIALGIASMLWLLPWLRWMPPAAAATGDAGAAPGACDILRQRSAWGTFFGLFCGNYYWYFLMNWLPAYLETARGFSKPKMAVVASLTFFAAAGSSIISGWISDRWIARGGSPTLVRRTFTGLGLALSVVILPVSVIRDDRMATALLLLAGAVYGIFSSNIWAITQTLAGPSAAGTWTSIQNGIANLAGIAAPWFTGWIVERTGSFHFAFLVAAAVAAAGAAIYGFGIGPVKQVVFARRRE